MDASRAEAGVMALSRSATSLRTRLMGSVTRLLPTVGWKTCRTYRRPRLEDRDAGWASARRLGDHHRVRLAGIYGPYPNVGLGYAGPDSVLDLLVDFEPGRSLLNQIALTQDLEGVLGRHVDVVTEAGLSRLPRRRIVGEAHIAAIFSKLG